MQIEENVRLKFVGITTAIVLIMPFLIELILYLLMPGLRY